MLCLINKEIWYIWFNICFKIVIVFTHIHFLALIFDGNSEICEQGKINVCYLIFSRHLFRLRVITTRIFLSDFSSCFLITPSYFGNFGSISASAHVPDPYNNSWLAPHPDFDPVESRCLNEIGYESESSFQNKVGSGSGLNIKIKNPSACSFYWPKLEFSIILIIFTFMLEEKCIGY